ncbi:potassium channel family protein [Azospirillum baldaniorum]|nr:potassium channel family protein [Azospirillum baldaniorum]
MGLFAVTILAHVAGFRLLLMLLDRRFPAEGHPQPGLGRMMIVASPAIAILHHAEAALWAAVYIGLGILTDWDTAVYFSIVTMTTVGYGDVILTGEWRVLAAFQAMNGMLLSGLSTAFLFAILQQYWVLVRKNG